MSYEIAATFDFEATLLDENTRQSILRMIDGKMQRDHNEALCARDGHVSPPEQAGTDFDGVFCPRCAKVLDRERFERLTKAGAA